MVSCARPIGTPACSIALLPATVYHKVACSCRRRRKGGWKYANGRLAQAQRRGDRLGAPGTTGRCAARSSVASLRGTGVKNDGGFNVTCCPLTWPGAVYVYSHPGEKLVLDPDVMPILFLNNLVLRLDYSTVKDLVVSL